MYDDMKMILNAKADVPLKRICQSSPDSMLKYKFKFTLVRGEVINLMSYSYQTYSQIVPLFLTLSIQVSQTCRTNTIFVQNFFYKKAFTLKFFLSYRSVMIKSSSLFLNALTEKLKRVAFHHLWL